VTAADQAQVLFEVDDGLYALSEQQATRLGETLRVRAASQFDETYGMEGAEMVSDLIEDTLVGARSGPIPLEGDAAVAVYYALDSAIENPEDEVHQLYLAVRELHHALEEL
jgi:hypothetical protein